MKKKITSILIILILVVLIIINSGISANKIYYKNDIIKKLNDQIESNKIETNIITFGHISSLINITEITLINGSPSDIEKIQRIINNSILHLILPPFWFWCDDLDFSISYNQNVSFFVPYIRRISYFTSLYKDVDFPFNNATIWGRRHTVIVEGFDGYFCFQRLRPIRLAPVLFLFVGSYEKVTIIR